MPPVIAKLRLTIFVPMVNTMLKLISQRLLLTALLLPLFVAGCLDSGAPPHGRVAVLDLERLANDAGFKEQVRKALKETEATLNSGFDKARQAAGDQVNVRRQQFGDVPTAAQQAELRLFVERTRQELLAMKNKANSQLGARRQQLIDELKEHVRPVARAIASERGMDVVMLRTNNMLSYTEVSDITTAVLAKMSGASRALRLTPAKGPE